MLRVTEDRSIWLDTTSKSDRGLVSLAGELRPDAPMTAIEVRRASNL
jgi:hypothetical protein